MKYDKGYLHSDILLSLNTLKKLKRNVRKRQGEGCTLLDVAIESISANNYDAAKDSLERFRYVAAPTGEEIALVDTVIDLLSSRAQRFRLPSLKQIQMQIVGYLIEHHLYRLLMDTWILFLVYVQPSLISFFPSKRDQSLQYSFFRPMWLNVGRVQGTLPACAECLSAYSKG